VWNKGFTGTVDLCFGFSPHPHPKEHAMTSFRWTALAGLACALLIGAAAAQDKPAAAPAATPAAKDGKTLFLENKCNTCHTIQAAGVEKRKASSEEAAAESKDKSKSEKKPPDLSSVGLDQKPEWIAKYLMKTESIKGEKHGRKFRGTEPELKTVSEWLGSMKTPKKK